jgi:hypothetical protein
VIGGWDVQLKFASCGLSSSVAAIALSLCFETAWVGAQAPTRDELLARMAGYITRFTRDFSNVVAEEQYRQEVARPHQTRTLKSDFLLVTFPGADRLWLSFRDVFEVDGRSIRDRQEDRLANLFRQPLDDALRRAREIVTASEQYNIGSIGSLDNPLLALALAQAAYQPRFRYTAMGLARGMGAGIRVVEFREYQRPTVLRAGIGDLLTSGLVWMDEQSGRVVKTELDIHTQPRASRVVTTFTIDPVLGIDVPSEMEGRYFGQGEETITRARYSGFRKFSVQTQETFR